MTLPRPSQSGYFSNQSLTGDDVTQIKLNLIKNNYNREQELLWQEHDACQKKLDNFLEKNTKFLDFANNCDANSEFHQQQRAANQFALDLFQISSFLKNQIHRLDLKSENNGIKYIESIDYFVKLNNKFTLVKEHIDKNAIDPEMLCSQIREFASSLDLVKSHITSKYKEKSVELDVACLEGIEELKPASVNENSNQSRCSIM